MFPHSPAAAGESTVCGAVEHDLVSRDDAAATAARALLSPLCCYHILGGVLSFIMDARRSAHVVKVFAEQVLKVGRSERAGCGACRVQNEVRHHHDLVALRLVVKAHLCHMAPDSDYSGRTQHGLGLDVASARHSHHAAVVQAGRKGAGIVEREVGHCLSNFGVVWLLIVRLVRCPLLSTKVLQFYGSGQN